MDTSEMPPFAFHQPAPRLSFTECAPDLDAIRIRLRVPPKSFLEKVFPGRAKLRQIREQEALRTYQEESAAFERYQLKTLRAHLVALMRWRCSLLAAINDYESKKRAMEAARRKHNASVERLRADFESCSRDAQEPYFEMVLARSSYPPGISLDPKVQVDPPSRTVIVDCWLPTPSSLPRIVEYKYVASKHEIHPVEMKAKDASVLYESVIYQIALRTVHEVFDSAYAGGVDAVVFNGWMQGVDPKTGNDFTSCILSCRASIEEFRQINLGRVDPKECFRSLKGLVAGPLAQLAPVRPIMQINREDSRFIESKEILASLDPGGNLAEMDWEDFEHLVRELFAEIFAREGAEVQVTQASRDGGVDAIAFDPDPIRGGKFVIQAKRFNNVIPVSAVRDLYGTMINEGAAKGILVTTSYFGSDSRDFVKDKPITLIDGANLVHLFQEYGHQVHINLRRRQSGDSHTD